MILILGLNPVWQKVLTFDHFCKGQVNRSDSLISFASGKGINMVRALNQLAVPSCVVQPLGGATGELFLEHAKSFAKLVNSPMAMPIRTCTTCLDGQGSTTEIIEPSPSLSHSESEALLDLVANQISPKDSIILAGTIPDGVDLKRLAQLLQGKEVMLDNYQQLEQLLQYGIGTSLKINASELEHLMGTAGTAGIKRLLNLYPHLKHIAITNEAEASFLYSDSNYYEIKVENRWSVFNPIGAGDTSTATWTHFLSQGVSVLDAFVKSQAAARASCLTQVPGEYSVTQASEIEASILVCQL